MTAHERPFGRHLEDFVVGDVYRHWPGKTITEYDDHLFCMITMNHHPLHTNEWFGRQSVQGRNVVVGNLVYSLVLGMSVPDVSGAAIANLEVARRPGRGHGRNEGLQPGGQGGLLLPPQGHGVEAGRCAGAPSPLRRRRRLGRVSSGG